MSLTDFTIIRRSIFARAFSSATTVLMVAVAVGLMLVLLSMRDSGERAFERGAGNMHLLVSRDSSPMVSILNGVFYASAPARPIAWREFQRLTDPDSPSSLPLEWAVPIQLGDSYRGLPVLATTTGFFTDFRPDPDTPWSLAEGRYFERELEVVVGAQAALTTGLNVGDTIFVTHGVPRATAIGGSNPDAVEPHVHTEFAFKIVGILNPTGSSHDRALFIDLDSSWILHAHDRRLADDPGAAITTVADLIEADRLITGIYMRVLTRPGQNVSAILPQVFRTLRDDPSLTVASPTDQIRQLFSIVSNIDQIFVAMAAIVMVSSGIAIMLALYNSMEQRRRQIAVLRVLGCSRPRVFGLIVTESAVLGVVGAALGVALALAGGRIVAAIMKQRLGLVVEPVLPLAETLGVVVATIALAAAAGIVPAVMAYRTPVAKNLRPIG